MMTIVLPLLIILLAAVLCFLPIEDLMSRCMGRSPSLQSAGSPAPAPQRSFQCPTTLSPYQSRPPQPILPVRPATPNIRTPPRQPAESPQFNPRVSSASQLPGSACRQLTKAAIPHLCAELLVPDEKECNLVVPEINVSDHR